MARELIVEVQEQEKKRARKKADDSGGGRWGILLLLLVTVLLSLALYLKQRLAGGFSFEWPQLGGVERVTFEK